MNDHHHTEDSVPNDEHSHNPSLFDPAKALESLYAELVQLEAFTHAAIEAMAQLPFPKGREARLPFERVYTLISRAADDTQAAVRYGGELIDALGIYLKIGRPGEEEGPVTGD
jgi:hypothetical protein